MAIETQTQSRVKPMRLEAIDLLRGLVIVVMALDHVHDYFSISAGVFEPTDLSRTTGALFLTRWITHFCAPVFVFLAGVGAFQASVRGRTKTELSRLLLTRGLWLIALEVAFITPFGWSFQLTWSLIRLQVIWVIGCLMVILSGVVWLPSRLVGWVGLVIAITHNLFDGDRGRSLGPIWQYLHSMQFIKASEGHTVASLYPIVPWVGVMMTGYGQGEIWGWAAERRRQHLCAGGIVCLGSFVLMRLTNWYGDPSPWTPQPDFVFSLFSVLNVTKYPPSLSFLLMTLGPALLALRWLEVETRVGLRWLLVFGRVPLFFYRIHLPLIHGLAVLLSLLIHGDAAWLFRDPFALRRGPIAAASSYGFELPVVYLLLVVCVAVLYPLCRWYGAMKQQSKHPLLSYL
ncbi:MAG: DUF1624 domain-containing protein [Acidobacteria bacterium]|nr:DUF1624 domain-containing protein [Acidobacteriota bacterium]